MSSSKDKNGPRKDVRIVKVRPQPQDFINKFLPAYALFGKVLHEKTAMFVDGKADEQFDVWVPKNDQEAFNAGCRTIIESRSNRCTSAVFGCYIMMRLGRLNDPYLEYSMASDFDIDNNKKRLLWGINRAPDPSRIFVPLIVNWMNKSDFQAMINSLKALTSIPGMMMQSYFNGMWHALLSGEILVKPEWAQVAGIKEDEYEMVGEWCRLIPEKFKTLGITEVHPLITVSL